MEEKNFFKKVNCENDLNLFYFPSGRIFKLKSFYNGIMEIETYSSYLIDVIAKDISECFEKQTRLYGIIAIEIVFNDIYLCIVKSESKHVIKLWEDKLYQINMEKQKYLKSFECQVEKAKILKQKYRRIEVKYILRFLNATEKIKFKNDESTKIWNEYIVKNCNELYFLEIIQYAELWMKFMQYILDKNHNADVKYIAKKAAKVCNYNDISLYMLTYVIEIVSKVWIYGDEIKKLSIQENFY